jgi:hypothetical protein
MAVGVGAGVGLAMRRWGRGVAPKFGVAAAALALLGCLAGACSRASASSRASRTSRSSRCSRASIPAS